MFFRIQIILSVSLVLFYFQEDDLFGQKTNDDKLVSFKSHYSNALRSKYQEDYLVAINYLEECLKLLPESSASAYQLSTIYFKLNKNESSLEYINYALKYAEKNEWYLLHKSKVLGKKGDIIAYKKCYQLLHEYFPSNPVYAYELSILYYKNKEYNNSLKILNSIEATLGISENVSFLKNNIYYESKKYDLIRQELTKLISFFPDSVKYIDMLGEYFLSMQHLNAALNTYKDGLVTFPKNKKLSIKVAKINANINNFKPGYDYLVNGIGANNLSVEKQFDIAKVYLNAHIISKDQKIIVYETFSEQGVIDSEIENEYIKFLITEKELSRAEIKIKYIFKTHVDNFVLWNYLFSIFLSQNRIEELYEYSKEAKSYFPNQAIVYFYSGYSSFMLKNFEKACHSLLTGFDLVSDDISLKKDFLLYLAESYHARNIHDKSDSFFDQYLLIDSTNAYLLNNYSYYLAKRNTKLNKAFNLSRKSIEIEPFNSSFLDTYSWIYYLKKDYKNALFHIEKAYKYGGKSNYIICEHYGDILIKNNLNSDALIKWQESLKLNPKNEKLKKKIQSLN